VAPVPHLLHLQSKRLLGSTPYTSGTAWVRVRGDRAIEASVPSLVGKLLVSYFSRSKSRSQLAVFKLVLRVTYTFVDATTTIAGVPVVPVDKVDEVVAPIPLHLVRIA
jgi:hypothetical protein